MYKSIKKITIVAFCIAGYLAIYDMSEDPEYKYFLRIWESESGDITADANSSTSNTNTSFDNNKASTNIQSFMPNIEEVKQEDKSTATDDDNNHEQELNTSESKVDLSNIIINNEVKY